MRGGHTCCERLVRSTKQKRRGGWHKIIIYIIKHSEIWHRTCCLFLSCQRFSAVCEYFCSTGFFSQRERQPHISRSFGIQNSHTPAAARQRQQFKWIMCQQRIGAPDSFMVVEFFVHNMRPGSACERRSDHCRQGCVLVAPVIGDEMGKKSYKTRTVWWGYWHSLPMPLALLFTCILHDLFS